MTIASRILRKRFMSQKGNNKEVVEDNIVYINVYVELKRRRGQSK